MSSIEGKLESPVSSTRKTAKGALRDYSFPWIKWLVDKLFPAKALKLERDRSVALPTRR
jgi:hypothetical protein